MRIVIPEAVDFADLNLARAASGEVSFAWEPIERICEASGIDVAIFREGPEDAVGDLITAWYAAHRQRGGKPDPVQEALIAEALSEFN